MTHLICTDEIMRRLEQISLSAGEVILGHYRNLANVTVQSKKDGSPVTKADQDAEHFIVAELRRIDPLIPVIGEELFSAGEAPDIDVDKPYWLVDAVDGTKEFIAGTGEFTVNIALIFEKRHVMGIIYAPVLGQMYSAIEGKGSFRRDVVPSDVSDSADDSADLSKTLGAASLIKVRERDDNMLTVITSSRQNRSSEIKTLFNTYTIGERKKCGSSLKFCRIAEGGADLYPRLGPTCEWDTAAGDIILREAGGALVDIDNNGQLLGYGKKDNKYLNPSFVAVARAIWTKHKKDFTIPSLYKNK